MAILTTWPDCDKCPIAMEKMQMSVSIAKMMTDMERLAKASIQNLSLAVHYQNISENYRKQIASLEQQLKEINNGKTA